MLRSDTLPLKKSNSATSFERRGIQKDPADNDSDYVVVELNENCSKFRKLKRNEISSKLLLNVIADSEHFSEFKYFRPNEGESQLKTVRPTHFELL